jgi:hypothetical protein
MDRIINGRVKEPMESPVGRIQVGWRNDRPVFADIYPSDLIRAPKG